MGENQIHRAVDEISTDQTVLEKLDRIEKRIENDKAYIWKVGTFRAEKAGKNRDLLSDKGVATSIDEFATDVQKMQESLDYMEARADEVSPTSQQENLSLKKKTLFSEERDSQFTETAFMRGRSNDKEESRKEREACELYAIENFPLEKILKSTDPDINTELYDEITKLKNIYISTLITSEYVGALDFNRQRGLPRIELISFLLQKVRLCHNLGLELNKNNFDEILLKESELRLDKIENTIRQLLKEAFAIGASDPNAFKNFNDNISELTSTPSKHPDFPSEAPELYKERKNRKEKPEEFLVRNYGRWTHGNGLYRSHIKAWDKSLYLGLNKRRHDIPNFDTLLPTAQGRSVDDLARSDSELLASRRESSRKAMSKAKP